MNHKGIEGIKHLYTISVAFGVFGCVVGGIARYLQNGDCRKMLVARQGGQAWIEFFRPDCTSLKVS